jgi:hypothetical protein
LGIGTTSGAAFRRFADEVLAPGTIGTTGGLDPVRPVILPRPDVIGDDNWVDGFEGGWLDRSKSSRATPKRGAPLD